LDGISFIPSSGKGREVHRAFATDVIAKMRK